MHCTLHGVLHRHGRSFCIDHTSTLPFLAGQRPSHEAESHVEIRAAISRTCHAARVVASCRICEIFYVNVLPLWLVGPDSLRSWTSAQHSGNFRSDQIRNSFSFFKPVPLAARLEAPISDNLCMIHVSPSIMTRRTVSEMHRLVLLAAAGRASWV